MKLTLLSHRDKVFCSVWAWHSTNRKFIEICIRIVYGLCFEEPLLWDRDAYSMWALWYEPNSVSTKGSCCTVGSINRWPRPSFINHCLVRGAATLFYCTWSVYLLTEKHFEIQLYEILHFLPCFFQYKCDMSLYVYHYLLGHVFLTHMQFVVDMMVMIHIRRIKVVC